MRSHERTPLLTTVVVVAPRPRYPHGFLRRFCTISLSASLISSIAFLIFTVPWVPGDHSDQGLLSYLPWFSPLPHDAWPSSEGLPYAELEELLLTTPDEAKAHEWSRYYASGPHLAGKNRSQALWTRDRWHEFGIDHAELVEYEVYLNYPLSHRLALLEKNSEDRDEFGKLDGEVKVDEDEPRILYECSLEEDVLEKDETSGLKDRIPTFHGYSANGNVTAQFVYVNYGSYWDFEDLIKANISLAGKIAIARYGHVYRGLKVKRAEELGMTAMVIYSDPRDDGNVTVANGFKAYPDGPARNPSSVQRGSVEYMSIAPGDPTTPGYPSKPGAPRRNPGHAIPSIPSLPISYKDALPILQALNGHGPRSNQFNKWWQKGGVELNGVEYYIGPSPPNIVLNLVNEQEYVITPLWNVIGSISGTLEDEVIVLGNHRDAWIAGGAGDPNSGSAALNEVVRSFGIARSKGWKPLRSIVFASWDGEEYSLIGSTEWVEEYLPWLSKSAVAYLNVDIACSGPRLHMEAAPLLNRAILAATSRVASPNQTVPGQTVQDLWDPPLRPLGSGSDFTAFQDFAGIPSFDLGFAPSSTSPVYHYHSNYDSLSWMENFGDVGWHYHIATAKIWGLLAAHLIESAIIPFNATDYAVQLSSYLTQIQDQAAISSSSSFSDSSVHALSRVFLDISDAIASFLAAAIAFDNHAASIAHSLSLEGTLPWWRWYRKVAWYFEVRRINNGYKYLERQFLHESGLDGRSLFKHTIFAPGIWSGYAGVTFPGLTECVENGDEEGMQVCLFFFFLRSPLKIFSCVWVFSKTDPLNHSPNLYLLLSFSSAKSH